MSLPNNTPLSVAELTRLLELMAKPRRSIALTPSELYEYQGLAGRANIPVVYPNMPPTIIIPITHETDFICGDPGVGGNEA
jgi:hypothetical protein